MRMKYSVPAPFESPSTSSSVTRYEPSLDTTRSAFNTWLCPFSAIAGPSLIVNRPRATGLSAVIVSSTFVPAGA